MNEELDSVPVFGPSGHELSRVRDEMHPAFQRDPLALKPFLEMRRAGEDADALARPKTMARLLADDPCLVLRTLLDDSCGRDPHLGDLHAALALILFGMVEVEELGCATDVVVVEMRERDHVDCVAERVVDVLPEGLGQIDATIIGVVGIQPGGVVAQHQFLFE